MSLRPDTGVVATHAHYTITPPRQSQRGASRRGPWRVVISTTADYGVMATALPPVALCSYLLSRGAGLKAHEELYTPAEGWREGGVPRGEMG